MQNAAKLNYSLTFDNNNMDRIDLSPYFATPEELSCISKFKPDPHTVNLLLNFGLSFNQCAWLCKLNDNDAQKVNNWMGDNFDKMQDLDNEEWNRSDFDNDISSNMNDNQTKTCSVNSFITHLGSN